MKKTGNYIQVYWLIVIILIFCFYQGCGSQKKCANSTCGENEICTILNSEPKCLCDNDFVRINGKCILKDRCQSFPCVFGICSSVDIEPYYYCSCNTGYAGINCDECDMGYENVDNKCVKIVDPCYPNPCIEQNKSICNKTENGYECSCDNGFILQGDNCIVSEEDPCNPNPCTDQNKSICTSTSVSFTCNCDDGYIMLNNECVLNGSNPCEPNPCVEENRNICVPEEESYECVCNSGYNLENQNCIEDELNPCIPNPCLEENRTECTVFEDTYNCECDSGYVHENNQCVMNESNPCNPNPCIEVNKSVCIETDAGYICECDIGFIDNNGICEEDDNCNPGIFCSGHGYCSDDGQACICENGYSGLNCQTCLGVECSGTCLKDNVLQQQITEKGKYEILGPVGDNNSQYSPFSIHEPGWESHLIYYCKNTSENSIHRDRVWRTESFTGGIGDWVGDQIVIQGDDENASDDLSCSSSVVIDANGTWHMYYVTASRNDSSKLWLQHATANSPGITWTKLGNISLTNRSQPFAGPGYLETPTAILLNNIIHLYYVDEQGLYLAKSSDGHSFDEPLLVHTKKVSHGRVTHWSGIWAYVYSVNDTVLYDPPNSIYLSLSCDGENFTDGFKLVQSNGTGWDAELIWSPHVLFDLEQPEGKVLFRVYYAGTAAISSNWWGSNTSIGVRTFEWSGE